MLTKTRDVKASTEGAMLNDSEEWRLRCELAACFQLTDLYGMTDLCSTHISVRMPGPENHFLINSYGSLFCEVTASSLIKVDMEGRLVAGEGQLSRAAFVIHSAVHMYRHEIVCVMHTHTAANNAIAMVKEGLLPLTQKAMVIQPFIRYHDYEGVADDLDERSRIARDLGPEGRIVVLRNHGALFAGLSVAEAFVWSHRFETACSYQVAGLSMGMELQRVSAEGVDLAGRQGKAMLSPGGYAECGRIEWPALIRKLERERGHSYRT